MPRYWLRPNPRMEHPRPVQRLFSMFPTGSPGIALLLLRASVAIALVIETYGHRQDLPRWLEATAIVISVAISAGYLTPIAAVAGVFLHTGLWWSLGAVGAADTVVFCLDAGALALLGPGAYSVDSYRFGRRRVVVPPP